MRGLIGLLVILGGLIAGGTPAAASCVPTDFERDGHFLTALLIDPPSVTGDVDAGMCDIAVYVNAGSTAVADASVHNARYFGILARGTLANVTIEDSIVYDIGDDPKNGSQHGVAIMVRDGASGTISGTTVYDYQKGGIVIDGVGSSAEVTGSTTRGAGAIDWIAQNGIQVSRGATATLTGNEVSGNDYTPPDWTSCGILYFDAAGVRASQNHFADNEMNVCNFGERGGGNP